MLKKIMRGIWQNTKRVAQFAGKQTHDKVLPAVRHLLSDDTKVRRATNFSYRFLPFPVKFVFSKERYSDFLIARKNWVMNQFEPISPA